MTKAQQETVKTVAANGGYVCCQSGNRAGWWCAFLDQEVGAFIAREPKLSTRVMRSLWDVGLLERAGPGYSAKAFFRIREVPNP